MHISERRGQRPGREHKAHKDQCHRGGLSVQRRRVLRRPRRQSPRLLGNAAALMVADFLVPRCFTLDTHSIGADAPQENVLRDPEAVT